MALLSSRVTGRLSSSARLATGVAEGAALVTEAGSLEGTAEGDTDPGEGAAVAAR